MLDVRLADRVPRADAVAIPVRPPAEPEPVEPGEPEPAAEQSSELAPTLVTADGVGVGFGADTLPADVGGFLAGVGATGEAGEVQTLPLPGTAPPMAYLVGVGTADPDGLRRAGGAAARAAAGRAAQGLRHLAVTLGHDAEPDGVRALVEGLCLGGYRFSRRSSHQQPGLRRVTVVVGDPDRHAGAMARGLAAAGAGCGTRDLVNTPSSEKTPAWLAGQAGRWLAPLGVSVRVRAEEQLAAEGFGGILAVGGGSTRGPRLIEARWAPRGAGGPRVVLVGKGITFDTGGLCIKPVEGMNLMKTDMAGGAAVLGALAGAAELRLPLRVTALVPAAENAVSGSAYRPGDVIRQYGGRTTEVLNTDAEGRVVLADALAYAAARLRPDLLVDVATLTGAVRTALGSRTAGLFATDDDLAGGLLAAGQAAGESLWRLPLLEEYADLLDSDVADANNAPGSPGAVTAALFLQPFAGGVPWAHLDIAGAARATADDAEVSRGGTGFGARTLLRWLEALATG